MKKIFALSLYILLITSLSAEEKEPAMAIRSWKISPNLGNEYPVDVDTIPLDFQHFSSVDGYRSPRGSLGNLGSPSYSRIFFLQKEAPRFLFSQVYEPYFLTAEKVSYFNTTIPLTNLTYTSGGSSNTKEERFRATFCANAGKKLNIGADFENIYARGFYASSAVSDISYKLFSSYKSDHYGYHAFFGNSNLSNYENGGIQNDVYITNPTSLSGTKNTFESVNIPVNLEKSWNRINGGMAYLNHHYDLGFYRSIKKDTTETKEFVPVSGIIHTFQYNTIFRRFVEKSFSSDFYQNHYIDTLATNDTTSYKSFQNTVALRLYEGFNKYAVFGLTAYLRNEIRKYQIIDPAGKSKYNQNSTFIGAELSRQNSKILQYTALAEVGILGEDLGQFTLSGEIKTQIKIFKRDLIFKANGFIKNINPGFYLNHYHSNHFWWDNAFNDERRVRLEGEISIPEERFSLKAGVENLQNYIYFNNKALPTQESENIQILSASVSKDFKWGILHLDNEIHGQYSSMQKVIPLPDVSLYHNLYLRAKLAKVLTLQAGADVRYFTSYYAPAFQPAISQFHTQSEIRIGNYPLVSVYANLHLKRTRFFVMYYHASENLVEPNYFTTPHYPINPGGMKMGVSWNFNN